METASIWPGSRSVKLLQQFWTLRQPMELTAPRVDRYHGPEWRTEDVDNCHPYLWGGVCIIPDNCGDLQAHRTVPIYRASTVLPLCG